jgi:hypothetical protein
MNVWNLHTDQERKNRVCPIMTNHRQSDYATHDGLYGSIASDQHVICLGDGCELWVWVDPPDGHLSERESEETRRTKDEDVCELVDQHGWIQMGMDTVGGEDVYILRRGKVIGPRRGFCGLVAQAISLI